MPPTSRPASRTDMPPPLDLTGRRFGALTVRKRGRTPSGKTAWRCLCDCGREELVPLNRLNIGDSDPRAIRACEHCMSRPCVVCGTLYLRAGAGKTCGADACRVEVRRATNAAAAARAEALDPGLSARRERERRQHIRETDPTRHQAMKEASATQVRERRARMDDTDRALRRAYRREYYDLNRDRLRASFDRWLDELPLERRQEWDERRRAAVRSYRRQKALAQMLRDAGALVERGNHGNDD